MKLRMSHTVCIILVNAALAVPIRLTGAAIAHISVNTLEEPFLLGCRDKYVFSFATENERGRMHRALHGGREELLLIVSPNEGTYLLLFFVFMCACALAIYSPLNFISDFMKW